MLPTRILQGFTKSVHHCRPALNSSIDIVSCLLPGRVRSSGRPK
jgi:hypothetical protein